jgi:hypothetical protein
MSPNPPYMTQDYSKLPEVTKPLELARGLFLIVEFSAKGGTVYRRIGEETKEVHADESMTAEYATRKEVDHIGLQTWSRKIVNAAYNVMERNASPTPIGYWVSEENAPKLLAEIDQVKLEARKLNDYARSVNSRRRAEINVYSMVVGKEDEEKAAKRLAQTVRERLDSLREDLASGDLNAYATSWKRAKNLPKLATGIQAESIVLALEAARESRSKLAEAIKNKQEPQRAGASLDLTAIESAIFLFTDSVNGTLAQIEDPEIDGKIF